MAIAKFPLGSYGWRLAYYFRDVHWKAAFDSGNADRSVLFRTERSDSWLGGYFRIPLFPRRTDP